MKLNLKQRVQQYNKHLPVAAKLQTEGRLTRLAGMTLEAVGCHSPIGTRCLVTTDAGHKVEAEIVGFDGIKSYLMCTDTAYGLAPGARILSTGHPAEVAVGEELLGRVINGNGKPLDAKGYFHTDDSYPLKSLPYNPLQRAPIDRPLDVGVRAVNALLSIGRGQRMGLFAGSGVGKSVLLSMMTRYTEADVIVVGLIGERGREVKDFIDNNLGAEGMRRSVIVAAPADQSPLMRAHGALRATSIAEYFRDQGKHVLLLMDSLTRFAQAQREVGLSIGEPPTTKGYPPSVFAKLPQLVERAGNADVGGGSITAIYTVLAEGDDTNDPVADCARAILDGHIVLSRDIAEQGLYPAIDIEASISRVQMSIVSEKHLKMVQQFKYLYSKYQQNKDIISIGAYAPGSDSEIDAAITMQPMFRQFLSQSVNEKATFGESSQQLETLFSQFTPAPAGA